MRRVARCPRSRVSHGLARDIAAYPYTLHLKGLTNPIDPRRLALGAAQKILFDGRDPEQILDRIAILGNAPSQPSNRSMSRPRDRILANLDEMYREAFERAKATGDQSQMATLDFAYRREQLYFEILLDVRDAMERR
ncbi:MAG TPA: hypothetical protein VGT98_06410 [Candidatus Elarobacter sp.]|nr:hypothetical protein [Candidatus Elarobacter sp.]